MSNNNDLSRLIDRHLRGELDDTGREQLAQLLDSDADARRLLVEQAEWDARFTDVLRIGNEPELTNIDLRSDASNTALDATDPILASAAEEKTAEKQGRQGAQRRSIGSRAIDQGFPIARVLLAIAAVVIVWLGASLYSELSQDRPIAQITGLSGPLLWTGDGGLIEPDLRVGTVLTGGTLEGRTPNSWVEIEFNDGSVITISGNSVLTFTDDPQKELYLRDGMVSANVNPQPDGQPMLIHTRTATVEVLGTQLNLEAGLTSTTLNVTEGKVRMTRLTDGTTVDVPAHHRATASDDSDLAVYRVPDAIHHWQSELRLGPTGTQGKWVRGTDQQPAALRAIPYVATPRHRKSFTIYSTGFGISRGEHPPVVVRSDSQLRVQGRLPKACPVYFGMTVMRPSGEFAGKYQVNESELQLDEQRRFDVLLRIEDFALDPSLNSLKDELAGDPIGSVVEALWCHTLNQPAGLEITSIELVAGAAE